MNYRKKANITLSFVAVGFVITAFLRHYYPDSFFIRLVSFVIEAALVGGVADWFAVTALFKKPLGFSFHTAIIPKNREKIIDSVAKVVEREFLSVDLIKSRLEKVKIVDGIINWIEKKGRIYIINLISEICLEYLDKFDTAKISAYVKKTLSKIENGDFSKYLSEVIIWGLERREFGRAVSKTVDKVIEIIEQSDTRNKIYDYLNEIKKEKTQGFISIFFNKTLEKTNSINISELTDTIYMHLLEFLYAARDEDNEANYKLREFLKQQFLVSSSITLNEKSIDKIREGLLNCAVDEDTIKEALGWLKGQIKQELYMDYEIEDKTALTTYNLNPCPGIVSYIKTLILSCWDEIKNNLKARESIENSIKDTIYEVITREHSLIGNTVKDTLNSFTDDDLNNLIEEKVGNDLQWIRINGSIVGGGIGLLIFLFMNLLYEPYVVPIIKGLFIQ